MQVTSQRTKIVKVGTMVHPTSAAETWILAMEIQDSIRILIGEVRKMTTTKDVCTTVSIRVSVSVMSNLVVLMAIFSQLISVARAVEAQLTLFAKTHQQVACPILAILVLLSPLPIFKMVQLAKPAIAGTIITMPTSTRIRIAVLVAEEKLFAERITAVKSILMGTTASGTWPIMPFAARSTRTISARWKCAVDVGRVKSAQTACPTAASYWSLDRLEASGASTLTSPTEDR